MNDYCICLLTIYDIHMCMYELYVCTVCIYVCMYKTPTRKSYSRVRADCDLDIGLHGIGSGHSSIGRVAQHRDERKTLDACEEMNTS